MRECIGYTQSLEPIELVQLRAVEFLRPDFEPLNALGALLDRIVPFYPEYLARYYNFLEKLQSHKRIELNIAIDARRLKSRDVQRWLRARCCVWGAGVEHLSPKIAEAALGIHFLTSGSRPWYSLFNTRPD
eukprot:scaffold272675_cov31-Tisochrysis_lutea.AAC.7